MLKFRLALKAADLPYFLIAILHNTERKRKPMQKLTKSLINLLNLLQKTVLNNTRLEGRAAIWRAPDRLKKYADRNLMTFNKDRCRLTHLGWNEPIQE